LHFDYHQRYPTRASYANGFGSQQQLNDIDENAIAGKLDVCLFDKTGTLTTDELVAVGVCEPNQLTSKVDPKLTAMSKVNTEAGFVLAGCHSLVLIEGETTGDPLESAALHAMRWAVSADSRIVPALPTEKKEAGKSMKMKGNNVAALEILSRHHFSSKLQRMSCVAKDLSNKSIYAVAKGSPEAIGNLLSEKPDGYDRTANVLSKNGYRVIALAYKPLSTSGDVDKAKEMRSSCEEKLQFAGFITFTCRVRKDTRSVLDRLKEGGMSVVMVTGDALLTAAHVAKEVGICFSPEAEHSQFSNENDEELKALLRRKNKGKKSEEAREILILDKNEKGRLYWKSYADYSHVRDFVASEVPEVASKFDLATTGKCLAAAFEADENTRKVLSYFKIFARMSPDAKETVIECLHSVGALCLMCGDGANDVGALKQSDVGVALLSGFGDLNVDKGEDGNKKFPKQHATTPQTAIMTKAQIDQLRSMPVSVLKAKLRAIGTNPDQYPDLVEKEDLVKLFQIKSREIAVKNHDRKNAVDKAKMTMAERKTKQREEMMEKQRKMQVRIQELEAQGEQWATIKAMREFWAQETEEGKKKKAEFAKKNSIEGSAASLAAQLEEMETGDLPMVKIGDASIAAPFTSKMPSIRSCVDIIRQGRCTLVTSIQMYQIMALNCLISAYSLSVLYLDGVKYGDVQMTAMGMLNSVSYMSVSRSKPLDKLSSVQPLTSIFHPSLFISLLGQFTVHLVTMIVAVRRAKQHLPPDYDVDLDGEFKPGIVNSVVFLVGSVQQVTVFVVNLQGRPFMTGMTENRPLLWSLVATFILTFMFASESVPSLNKYFQLVSFPDEAFRDFILRILVADVSIAFVFDRLMKFIFCRRILIASVEGTTSKDIISLGRTIGVILAIMYMFLGNDEHWEAMLAEEGRLDEMGNITGDVNGTNTSTMVEATVEAVATAAKVCVGAACKSNTDIEPDDEF